MAEIGPWVMGLAVALGSLLQGITGFGLAAVCIPVAMVFAGAKAGIVLILVLNCLAGALALAMTWPQVATAAGLGPLTTGSLLGVPVGVYLLARLPATALKVAVAALLLLLLVPDLLGRKRQRCGDGQVSCWQAVCSAFCKAAPGWVCRPWPWS